MRYDTRRIPSSRGALLLTLPDWGTFDAASALDELALLLREESELVDRIASERPSTFRGLEEPLSSHKEKVRRAWGPVAHMNSVAETPELYAIFEKGEALLAEHGSRIAMHEGLYGAYHAYRHGSPEYPSLLPFERKIIDDRIEDFELAGVALEKDRKERMTEIQRRLSELSSKIESNVKSAVAAWGINIEDESRLHGIPEATRESMRRAAEAKGKAGYLATLHAPVYGPVMSHATDRALREELYRAFVTRASDTGPTGGTYDNMPLIAETLMLRDEEARLLGFRDYTELALKKRMAKSATEIEGFLKELAGKGKERGKKEYESMADFGRAHLGLAELAPWDLAFVHERMQLARFGITQEELREYFPEGKALEGMFSLVARIYGAEVKETTGLSAWNEKVRSFELYDAAGELRGAFYADLFARDGKNQGAWMDIAVDRRERDGEVTIPVAYLNANFTEPEAGQESFLLHSEVETIFHEFGHVIHHLFTLATSPESSMNAVEWDAVECPSQVLEHWAWEPEILRSLSAHRGSGDPLPEEKIAALVSSRYYLSALPLLRQLEFALVDLRLHLFPKEDPLATLAATRREVRVTPVVPEDRSLASFTHIFAGGYASGYYSYLWAELLAADAFEAFKETGDPFDRSTGELFLEAVLERGSTRPFMESYRDFRGRDPDPLALLRARGLL